MTRWREFESTYCVTSITARNTGTWTLFFERHFQPLSVGGFFSNQRESISRCSKSPFSSKTQNRQIARTSPLNFDTVKLQIFVRYLFSYFRLETGSYVLIFVLSRVCEENDVEIQWLQSKKKFSDDIKFRTFSKVRNVRK